MSIRLLLVDDQELVRTGFRLFLETQDDLEVVGEVRSRGLSRRFLARRYPSGVYCGNLREQGGIGMSETVTYSVPAIHCAHCGMSIKEEVSEVEGVEDVDVDIDSRIVTIRGRELSDEKLRAAIEEAGYEAA